MNLVKSTTELVDTMGSDLTVVNAARVSFSQESWWQEQVTDEVQARYTDGSWARSTDVIEKKVLTEKDIKLINYLAKHNHWTPFAHSFASFRIKAPIFVARQLAKHQVGLAWNEVSRRYVDGEPEFFNPVAFRARAENVKQGSSEEFVHCTDELMADYESLCENLCEAYTELLSHEVAPEQARMILPQCAMTEWVWSGSLYAFSRVCNLRLDPHAQAETRDIADMIDYYMRQIYPYSWEALVK